MTTSSYHSRKCRFSHREKVEGRLHAAAVNGGAKAATPNGNGTFLVVGRAGSRYTVRAYGLETMTCDCRAGQFGNPCWHTAATYLRMIADAASTVAA